MPVLIRAARAADVPPGASRTVTLRGQPMEVTNEGGSFHVVAAKGGLLHRLARLLRRSAGAPAAPGTPYRTEVRGDFVFVAVDPDREGAPAGVQKNAKAPAPAAP